LGIPKVFIQLMGPQSLKGFGVRCAKIIYGNEEKFDTVMSLQPSHDSPA
jgi:hypothetical protein